MNQPNSRLAARRGALGRCPNCGKGSLFSGYLTVQNCPVCGAELDRYRAADGPAFFTMTAVGLLLVPILAIAYTIPDISPLSALLIVALASIVLTFALLRAIKGIMVGYLWSKGHIDRGA